MVEKELVENRNSNHKKLRVINEAKNIIKAKKIITRDIKDKLIDLGFREVVIGCKNEHEITNKQIKIDFQSYDIAIGLVARSIGYGCGR